MKVKVQKSLVFSEDTITHIQRLTEMVILETNNRQLWKEAIEIYDSIGFSHATSINPIGHPCPGAVWTYKDGSGEDTFRQWLGWKQSGLID